MIDPHLAGRLDYAHRLPTKQPLPPGRGRLGLFAERDAVLFVPSGVDPARPSPLVVLFHGGGGSAEKILPMLEQHAAERGFLLLAPQSLFPTWDLVIGGNGPDRERLDAALAEVASRFTLDPACLGFAGHSDGGSYALSLGLANGRFVTHLIASSAGFLSVHMQTGAPRIFMSHGTRDEQIPIERSGRTHAAKLRDAGYDVTYIEFDGPHAYQPSVVRLAVDFLFSDPSSGSVALPGAGDDAGSAADSRRSQSDRDQMPEATDNTALRRYEMAVDGETAFVTYRWDGDRLVLVHTEVPQALAGRGVGSTLARSLLEDIARRGLRIEPECTFIAGFIARHAEFASLAAAPGAPP